MNGIDGVVPINEAHRRRLEKTKANLEKLQARHQKDEVMEKVQAGLTKERLAGLRELAQMRIAHNEEIRDALIERDEAQTATILRIVEKIRTS